jgi:hypothetical protein
MHCDADDEDRRRPSCARSTWFSSAVKSTNDFPHCGQTSRPELVPNSPPPELCPPVTLALVAAPCT